MCRTICPNLTQLKRKAIFAVRTVDADLLQNAWNNSQARLHTIIKERDGHFEDLEHPVETLRDTEYHPKFRC